MLYKRKYKKKKILMQEKFTTPIIQCGLSEMHHTYLFLFHRVYTDTSQVVFNFHHVLT